MLPTTSFLIDSVCVPNLRAIEQLRSEESQAKLRSAVEELTELKEQHLEKILALSKSANSLFGGNYMAVDRNGAANKSARAKQEDLSDDSDDESLLDEPSNRRPFELALLNKERLDSILMDMRSIRDDPSSIILPSGGWIRLENHAVVLQKTSMRQFGHIGTAPTPSTTTILACHRGEELLHHIMTRMTRIKVDCIDVCIWATINCTADLVFQIWTPSIPPFVLVFFFSSIISFVPTTGGCVPDQDY